MKIELKKITVGELTAGFADNAEQGVDASWSDLCRQRSPDPRLRARSLAQALAHADPELRHLFVAKLTFLRKVLGR